MPDDGGSIVNVTSIEAHRAGPGFAIYSAMKAAQVSLTQSLALELGPRMIRVNCVAPDVIPTPGIGQDMGVRTPLPRAGHVDDVAAAIVFLANPALSGFVTGTTIHVDGGNSPPAAGTASPTAPTRREPADVKFGVALGALNPHFHLDAADAAEALGYESVWLPEHLVLPVHDEPLAARGRGPPAGPADRARLRRVHVPRASSPARCPTVRLGTHVYNLGLRHPFVAARAVQTLDIVSGGRCRVRDRRELARGGVGRGRARLPHPRPAGRRVARGLQAALDRARGRAPRRVLLRSTRSRSSRSRCSSRGRRSSSAARARPRSAAPRWLADGWIGMGHTFESAAGADRAAARARASRGTVDDEPDRPFQICVGGPVRSLDDVQRWEDIGVTRLVVAPWSRSPEAVDGLTRYAELVGLTPR